MTEGYYRFPTIHNNTIVFVSEDDLWTVSRQGGMPRRLTSNLGNVTYPMLSPDGQQLAFVGRDEGAPEVYVMPAEGGSARRLTYLSSKCRVVGWSLDGANILFTSTYGQVVPGEYGLFQIRADSAIGEAEPLPYGPAQTIAYGPNGQIVLGRNTGDPARWKRYRGGTAGHLWCGSGDDFARLLPDLAGNIDAPMWITSSGDDTSASKDSANDSTNDANERIYFVSDHEGIGNLYSCTPTGAEIARHTDHEDYYVRNPSTDGKQIVYHAGADLYVYSVATNAVERVAIEYRSPRVQRNRKFVNSTLYTSAATLHPSGRALTTIARGRPFTFYNHEGPVYQHGKRDGVRYRTPVWFNDGSRLLLISDETGEEALEIHTAEPGVEPIVLDGLDIGRVLRIKMSPARDMVAISNHRHELLIVDLEDLDPKKQANEDKKDALDAAALPSASDAKKTATTETDAEAQYTETPEERAPSDRLTVVDRSPMQRVAGFDWSPDGWWLAYGYAASPHSTAIRLYRLAAADAKDESLREASTHTITTPILHDIEPAFDPEGKYLYFLSRREFNPVYDALHFDLSFPWGMRPYLLTLQSDLPNPFIPVPDHDDDDLGDDSDEAETDTRDDEKDRNDDDKDEGGKDDADQKTDAEVPAKEAVKAADATKAADEISAVVDAKAASDTDKSDTDKSDADKSDAEKDASGTEETVGDGENSEAEDKAPKAFPRMVIDVEGIERRLLAFPVPDARYGQIAGIPGKALFTSLPTTGTLDGADGWDDEEDDESGALRAYDFKEYKSETLVDDLTSFALSHNRKKLIYFSGRQLRVINAGDKAPSGSNSPRKSGWIDLHRVKVSVDPPAEWQQMLREAWRLQRDNFWTEDMAQLDWQAVYQRYYPLIDRVSTRDELSDLVWEMQGELGTSHAYEVGGDYRHRPHYSQGFLGASMQWNEAAGGYIIGEPLLGDSWDPRATSPLAAPGTDVKAGDVLIAINGQAVDAQTSPAQLLVNQAADEVLLTLLPRPEEDKDQVEDKAEAEDKTKAEAEETAKKEPEPQNRMVVAKTLYSEVPVRYRAWVEGNRRAVHDATKGRVGYVHIPDMGPNGYAEFHRGYLAESDRDGLIVDVRYNAGGHVSQLILEKLARRRLGYDLSRWGGVLPYPQDSVAGPLVALTNEHAGSDGDIFCHSFKLLKLGPLIGKRTWGGVVGISPSHPLVDGTITTQPEFSFWFADVGWSVENFGTEPDIDVEIAPQDYAAGRDPQMERAIAESLALLETTPILKPDLTNLPTRPLPKLPPREG